VNVKTESETQRNKPEKSLKRHRRGKQERKTTKHGRKTPSSGRQVGMQVTTQNSDRLRKRKKTSLEMEQAQKGGERRSLEKEKQWKHIREGKISAQKK